MTARRDAIIKTFKSIQCKYGKHYCFPPYKVIQEILLKFYGLKAHRRTLYRDMKWLEENGFIGKQHRSRNPKIPDAKFKSNLYWLRREAYRYLESLWYWAKKHVHGFRETKKSLDKLPHSRVSNVFSIVSGKRGAFNPFKGRASPSQSIL
jgi:DNA-binding HxlR family transcriptional regulator